MNTHTSTDDGLPGKGVKTTPSPSAWMLSLFKPGFAQRVLYNLGAGGGLLSASSTPRKGVSTLFLVNKYSVPQEYYRLCVMKSKTKG